MSADFAHESFWVASAAAAPVIGLAHSILIGRNQEKINKWRRDVTDTLTAWEYAVQTATDSAESKTAATRTLRQEVERGALDAGVPDEFLLPQLDFIQKTVDSAIAIFETSHQLDLIMAEHQRTTLGAVVGKLNSAIRSERLANWVCGINLLIMAGLLGFSVWALAQARDPISPAIVTILLALSMPCLLFFTRADLLTAKNLEPLKKSRAVADQVRERAEKREVISAEGFERLQTTLAVMRGRN